MKKKIIVTIKIAISLILLFLVISKIDTKKLIFLLKEINLFWLFLAFIFFNLSKIVSSLRLGYYFKDIKIELDFFENLKLYYVGMFYNLFLPGGIGGDGYKVYLLKKRFKTPLFFLINATLLDRVSGLIGLIFFGGILFFFSSFANFSKEIGYLVLFISILIYPIFLYIHKRLFKRFLLYLKETTLLGLAVQALQLVCAYFIIKALPQTNATIDILTLFLISSILAVLPLTIGGVGIREFTFLYGFKLINQEPATGVAFAFLFFLITLISSAIGIFFIHKMIK